MAYIWEGYDDLIEYRQGKVVSPYIEMLPNDSLIRYVNPLLRFAAVFNALSASGSNEFEMEDAQRWMADNLNKHDLDNILFHYLALADRMKGVDRRQIQVDALETEILQGAFGSTVSEYWNIIRKREKAVILNAMVLKYGSDTLDNYFFIAIQKLFEHVSIIFEEDTGIYYLYISESENDYNRMLTETVKLLLWDIQERLRIIWRYHYGIIGNDDTMIIAKIRIV